MLALVLAMISLSNIGPDPIVTPAPALHDRLSGAAGYASGAPAPAANSVDIGVESCSTGAAQLGRDVWRNANALGSMLAMPACSAYGNSAWAPAASAFAFDPPFVKIPVWGPVRFEPAQRPGDVGATTTFTAPSMPARVVVRPLPVLRAPAAGSVRVLPRPLPVAAPLRRH